MVENNESDMLAGKKEYVPISGPELGQVLIGWVASKLLDNGWLGECMAYPGAKVSFALKIETQPMEEQRKLELLDSIIMDFAQPPDVIRVLNGLPIWEKIKVRLEGVEQWVEREKEASEDVKEAARGLVGGGLAIKGEEPKVQVQAKPSVQAPVAQQRVVGTLPKGGK